MSRESQTPAFNRRQLLRGSVAAATALTLTGSQPNLLLANSTKANVESAMQFGLVTYQWGKDLSLPELIAVCEKAGVAGVELRTEHKHGVEPELSSAERDEVRLRFDDSPVQLIGYGSNCEYHAKDPTQVAKNIEQTKRYIELMHDCGGSGVKVKPNGFPEGVAREKTIEQIGNALNEVAEYGQGYGQSIRVEVHGKGTSELPVIRDIFHVATHENVHVCWNCNAEDLTGEGLAKNFAMVQARFGDTVHIREMNVGDYPYQELMQLFLGIDYQGWILLEARTEPADKVKALVEQRELFEKFTANGN